MLVQCALQLLSEVALAQNMLTSRWAPCAASPCSNSCQSCALAYVGRRLSLASAMTQGSLELEPPRSGAGNTVCCVSTSLGRNGGHLVAVGCPGILPLAQGLRMCLPFLSQICACLLPLQPLRSQAAPQLLITADRNAHDYLQLQDSRCCPKSGQAAHDASTYQCSWHDIEGCQNGTYDNSMTRNGVGGFSSFSRS